MSDKEKAMKEISEIGEIQYANEKMQHLAGYIQGALESLEGFEEDPLTDYTKNLLRESARQLNRKIASWLPGGSVSK